MTDVIAELQREEKTERPPGKIAVSAYLTERQHERLEALAGRANKSHSKTIGRIIDMIFEQSKGGAA